jgi:hypothetical protein
MDTRHPNTFGRFGFRHTVVAAALLLGALTGATAQVSVGISLPGVSIGINLPVLPELVRIPGYPVYYAPQVQANFFFYDGLYWSYEDDRWYSSAWYNGPWGLVAPEFVPLYILRVPVRYYRQPPNYFRGWRPDAPPRWGAHWGPDWARHRSGWDRWDHRAAPAPAPLPLYQRQFAGDRYPPPEQQQALHRQNYRYQPRDATVRAHVPERPATVAPPPAQHERQPTPRTAGPGPRGTLPESPREAPRAQPAPHQPVGATAGPAHPPPRAGVAGHPPAAAPAPAEPRERQARPQPAPPHPAPQTGGQGQAGGRPERAAPPGAERGAPPGRQHGDDKDGDRGR